MRIYILSILLLITCLAECSKKGKEMLLMKHKDNEMEFSDLGSFSGKFTSRKSSRKKDYSDIQHLFGNSPLEFIAVDIEWYQNLSDITRIKETYKIYNLNKLDSMKIEVVYGENVEGVSRKFIMNDSIFERIYLIMEEDFDSRIVEVNINYNNTAFYETKNDKRFLLIESSPQNWTGKMISSHFYELVDFKENKVYEFIWGELFKTHDGQGLPKTKQ